jgi:hypothetical protein
MNFTIASDPACLYQSVSVFLNSLAPNDYSNWVLAAFSSMI